MPLFGNIELPNVPDPENVRRLDLLPIPMVRSMQRYGFRIDPPHFAALSARLGSRMAELRRAITESIPAEALDRFLDLTDDSEADDTNSENPIEVAPPEFQVDSSKRVRELLYEVLRLHLGAVKVKKTKGGDLTTGKKTLEQLKRQHPIVPLILEYRENAKLKGTYADSMPRRAKFHPKGPDCPVCGRHHWSGEFRVHTQILTTRTATGRTASKDPNMANIPTRTKLGAEIRAGFIASEGHVIVQRDWAQIELRLMAEQSGDETMLGVYLRDEDIHIFTAMQTFNITDPTKIDKMLHRAPSKNTNFAVAYLISGSGLMDLMAVTFATAGVPLPDYMTEHWCEQFIDKWFGVYKRVRPYLDGQESIARRYGIVWTPAGRVRRIPEVRSYLPYVQEAGVRQGCNHGIQGYSADIMKLAMGELCERYGRLKEYGIEVFPLMTVYDELLDEVEEDKADVLDAVKEEVMEGVLICKKTGKSMSRVPIKSDGKLLRRWTKE